MASFLRHLGGSIGLRERVYLVTWLFSMLTGVLMQTVGINALPAVLWVGGALFLASAWWERRKGFNLPAEEVAPPT